MGAISTIFYIGGCLLLHRLHIDDPVESAPTHLFGGIWGTLATGLFSNQHGVAYGFPDSGRFLGYQVVGIVSMFAWSSVCSILFFLAMKKLDLLRIAKEIEIIGLDVAELGGLSDDVY